MRISREDLWRSFKWNFPFEIHFTKDICLYTEIKNKRFPYTVRTVDILWRRKGTEKDSHFEGKNDKRCTNGSYSGFTLEIVAIISLSFFFLPFPLLFRSLLVRFYSSYTPSLIICWWDSLLETGTRRESYSPQVVGRLPSFKDFSCFLRNRPDRILRVDEKNSRHPEIQCVYFPMTSDCQRFRLHPRRLNLLVGVTSLSWNPCTPP